MNLIYNNEVLQDILLWANNNDIKFDYNGIENLIFVRVENHTNGGFGHKAYDDWITEQILELEEQFNDNPLIAFNQLLNIIESTRQRIKNEIFGSSNKLDDLN